MSSKSRSLASFRPGGRSSERVEGPGPSSSDADAGRSAQSSDEEEGASVTTPEPAPGYEFGSIVAGQLVINVVGASGLVPSEPYVKILVKTGSSTHAARTPVGRRTTDAVEWAEGTARFSFLRTFSEATELVLTVKNHRGRVQRNERLGQLSFRLEDLELPSNGDLLHAAMPLLPVLHGGRRGEADVTVQGELRLQIGWRIEDIDVEMAKAKEEESSVRLRTRRSRLRGLLLKRSGPDEDGSGGSSEEDEIQGEAISSAEQAEAKQAQQEHVQKMINNPFRPGDYRLQVHVIEARDLVGRDMSNLSDPVLVINAFGQKQRTVTKHRARSVVWDEHLFFDGKDLTQEDLTRGVVDVQVYDVDSLSRNDLIGNFSIDLPHLYYSDNHEIYRKWVALSAPAWAREGLKLSLSMTGTSAVTTSLVDDEAGGVQGYVRLSLTLLGPGDKAVAHDQDDEEDHPSSALMCLPEMRRELRFLRVRVLRAEQLPDMDKTATGGTTAAGLDAFVHLKFNGYGAKTEAIKSKNPAWMQEFWIPVLMPTVGQLITITVKDRDTFSADDDIDVLTVPFDDVLSGRVPLIGWWHLYGTDKEPENVVEAVAKGAETLAAKAIQRMQRLVERRRAASRKGRSASEWRGKLLLEMSVMRREDEGTSLFAKKKKAKGGHEHLMMRHVEKYSAEPQRAQYELQAAVILGVDLDASLGESEVLHAARSASKKLRKAGQGSLAAIRGNEAEQDAGDEVFIELVVENHVHRTRSVPVLDGWGDFITGGDTAAAQPGVLQKVNYLTKMRLPADTRQLADVLVYLCSKKHARRLAFARLPVNELLEAPYEFAPSWVRLQPIEPQTARRSPSHTLALPSLFMHVKLGVVDGAEGVGTPEPISPWPPVELPSSLPFSPYEVRVHLFQGRHIPPADDDGLVDPYVTLEVAGHRLHADTGVLPRSNVEWDSVNPQWFQTMRAQLWLPEQQYAPPLTLNVWDWDRFDADDMIGSCELLLEPSSLAGANVTGKAEAAETAELTKLLASASAARLEQMNKAAQKLQSSFRGFVVRREMTEEGRSKRAPLRHLRPSWHALRDPLEFDMRGSDLATSQLGDVLVQLELVRLPSEKKAVFTTDRLLRQRGRFPVLSPSTAPLPDLTPDFMQASVHVAVLGLQNVIKGSPPPRARIPSVQKASRFLHVLDAVTEVQKPFVEIDAGSSRSAELAFAAGVASKPDLRHAATRPSCVPSATNPLHNQVLELQVSLPTNPIFMSVMRVLVKDALFGGLRTPLLGSTDIDLSVFLPDDLGAFVAAPATIPEDSSASSAPKMDVDAMVRAASTIQSRVRGRSARAKLEPMRRARLVIGRLKQRGNSLQEASRPVVPGKPTGNKSGRKMGNAARGRIEKSLKDVKSTSSEERPAGGGGAKAQGERKRRRRTSANGAQQSDGTKAQIKPTEDDVPDAEGKEVAEVRSKSSKVATKPESAKCFCARYGCWCCFRRGGTTAFDVAVGEAAFRMSHSLGFKATSALLDEAGQLDEAGEKELERELDKLEEKMHRDAARHLRIRRELSRPNAVGCSLWRRTKALGRKAKLHLDMQTIEASLIKISFERHELEKTFDLLGDSPAYMNGRAVLPAELELDDVPYERFAISSGQGDRVRRAATMHALLSITPLGRPLPAADRATVTKLTTPREYVVRVYVLRGVSLPQRDAGFAARARDFLSGVKIPARLAGSERAKAILPKAGKGPSRYADPFLKVKLGGTTLGSREDHLNDVVDAPFYQRFELSTRIPGEAQLVIECWDHDWDGDELIGTTEISLMDRCWSERWQKEMRARPPLERRSLYCNQSSHPQGHLEMWVDLLTPEQAAEQPSIDIEPGPPLDLELRVVCWEAQLFDPESADDSGMCDLYCSFKFGNSDDWSDTDTHARALSGKAAFNYRLKWPVTLDPRHGIKSENSRLTVQLWDLDVISVNDCLGTAVLDLHTWFRRYSRRNKPRPAYCSLAYLQDYEGNIEDFDPFDDDARITGAYGDSLFSAEGGGCCSPGEDPMDQLDPLVKQARFWLPITNNERKDLNGDPTQVGRVMLSLQLVPKAQLDALPAGTGQEEPNSNPHLPKPPGRYGDDSLIMMLYRLIGPKWLRYLACLLITGTVLYFGAQFLQSVIADLVAMGMLGFQVPSTARLSQLVHVNATASSAASQLPLQHVFGEHMATAVALHSSENSSHGEMMQGLRVMQAGNASMQATNASTPTKVGSGARAARKRAKRAALLPTEPFTHNDTQRDQNESR